MLSRFSHFKKYILLVVAMSLLVIAVSSCSGGGTVGTGDSERVYKISGRVNNLDRSPIDGLEVRTARSEQSVTTDSNGQFSLESQADEDNQIILELRKGSLYAEALILIESESKTELEVEIEVDQLKGIVTSVNISKIEPDPAIDEPIPENSAITQTYKGQFLNALNSSIAGVKVTERRSKKSAKSDRNGRFRLRTERGGGEVKFDVSYRGLKGSFVLKNVSENKSTTINFKIRLAIEEAGVDPGSGEPKKILNLELIK